LEQLLFLLPELLGLLEVLFLDRQLFVLAGLGDLFFDGLVVGGSRHAPDTQAAACLVYQVDRLVGKVAVGDVTIGQVGSSDHGLVGDRHTMVGLVPVTQALQDLDRVGQRWLLNLDRLEPPLESSVFFEVLAVLVERRSAYGLQLPTGEHRLQYRGGIDGAFGRAGPDQRVQLVYEQDDVATCADLLQHLLQALLEVAPVARPGNKGTQVEGVQLFAPQGLGDLAGDDALRKALDDGGLAHARLTDQDRVVLRPPGQDLHDPLDLAFTPDDRVELVLPGELGEVAAELVQDRAAGGDVLGSGSGTGWRLFRACCLVAGQQLDHLLADTRQVGPEAYQHLGRDTLALPDEAKQHVLGADVVVTELERLSEREL